MSDHSEPSERLTRLRRVLDKATGGETGLSHSVAEELWEVIEQLEVENEELQRTRQETEELHHQFADLYEHAPVGYLILSPKFLIQQANETAREFLGPNRITLGASALGSFVHPDYQDEYYRALQRCQERGGAEDAEICVEDLDGKRRWLLLRISHDANAKGEPLRYRVTLSDITERVEAQQHAEERRTEVEELLEEKELLLREIHHRVKNDFHLISSFLSIQAGKSSNPEVKAAMEDARNRVAVMIRIYQRLHNQAQFARVHLASLVEAISEGFEGGQRITVRRDLEEIEVPTNTALSLGLILNELLTNARKYAFGSVSEPDISVRLSRVNEDAFEVELADNGPGFPPAVVEGGSFGFGLSVARSLAEQHHGTLTLENGAGLKESGQERGDIGAVVRVRMQRG